jgi:hypothetical protein
MSPALTGLAISVSAGSSGAAEVVAVPLVDASVVAALDDVAADESEFD